MISLVETGLMNALLAVGLALPVLILGRIWQRPALIHAFWILVLIKLVSPPLYHVPVTWSIPVTWHVSGWGAEAAAPIVRPKVSTRTMNSNGREVAVATEYSLSSPRVSSWQSAAGQFAAYWWNGLGRVLRFLESLVLPALFVSLLGSICWFAWQGWLVVRFAQVFLRSAQLAPEALQQQARVLAQPMGIKRCPEVWLLPAVVSPMLWSVGGKPRILFPSALLSRLDECAVATLLTHELAHYRRGDHQVRMLEFLASGLFWWHPIVWVARRELEIAEEQCCDAWVVSQFPASQRRYADALLATVDFLSEEHPPVPAMASGLGDVPMLRQRLKLIMCGTAPKSLSAIGRLAVILTAMLIPISPSLRAKTEVPRPAVNASAALSGGNTPGLSLPGAVAHSRSLDLVQDRAALLKRDIEKLSLRLEASRLTKNGAALPMVATIPEQLSAVDEQSLPSLPAEAARSIPAVRHVSAMATAPNGISRVVAWTNGSVEWQRIDRAATVNLTPYRICTILYSSDSHVFLTGCRDGIVRIWDASTCQLLSQLEGHDGTVRAIALAPQGNRLATADQQGLVLLWTFDGQSEARPLTTNCSAVNSLAFSADGQTLALGTGSAAATDSGQVQIWDLQTETLSACLEHQSSLAAVSFSADGKSVSGIESDGTLLTWDLEDSTVVTKPQPAPAVIPSAAVAPQS